MKKGEEGVGKVLFGTDGSDYATAAMRTALRLMGPKKHELNLLCVAPSYRRGSDGARQKYERRILGETAGVLERGASVAGGDAHLLTGIGSPAAVIVDKAKDYDLTVLGALGRGASNTGGLGAVASRVLEHASSPVLIARELRSDDSLRILVAVDGSGASIEAVETLRQLFHLEGAEICLMHVAETPWIQLGLDQDWDSSSEEEKENSEAGVLEKEFVREGEVIIERARDQLRAELASITTREDEGNPANEILSEAERGQYDLIVAGATGNRDLKHRMLGSVSSRLAWDAGCSVLIVHEPDSMG